MTAPPKLISLTAHALSGRRFDTDFHKWFPWIQTGQGAQGLLELALKAAVFLVDLFASVWYTNGSRRYQVKFNK